MTIIEEKSLIFSEAGSNNNKHYKLQLFDDGKVLAIYGRIGVTEQRTEYSGGKHFFDKQIRSKLKKGYTELKVVPTVNGATTTFTNSGLHDLAKRQIIRSVHPELDKLIDRLGRANIHKITSSTQISYNDTTGLFSTPLGIVTPASISEARDVLVTIKRSVDEKDYKSATFLKAVSAYLRIVPTNVGMKIRPESLFPDDTAIQNQNSILDSLEASFQALQSKPKTDNATQQSAEEKVFEVKLDLLTDRCEYDRIVKKYYDTRRDVHVCSHLKPKQVFTIELPTVKQAFETKGRPLGEIKELWHGSSFANVLSILKGGLKIRPPSTTSITGSMFSTGLYFSSASTKSLGYSSGFWTGQREREVFMFLADVALGRYYIPSGATSSHPPTGYHSYWAQCGRSGIRNDEFIIQKEYQHNLKYLIEFN